MKTEKWTEEEINYVIENRLEKSYSEIGKDIGRTRSAVLSKLNKMGYKLPEKYSYDSDFFEKIDTEEKAYWLGFFYADGYVNITKQKKQTGHEVGLELKKSDIGHLKKFNKSINGNFKPIIRTRKPTTFVKKFIDTCSIRIYSKKMVYDLINAGVTQRKTFTIEFPFIEDYLVRHFIRGFFDGDGSLWIDNTRNFLKCKFTSASPVFINQLRNTLYCSGIESYIVKSRNVLDLCIGDKKSVGIFLNYIYQDSNIFLDRKKKLYYDNEHLSDYIYKKYNT